MSTTQVKIRRNADGQQSLRDLRKALDCNPKVSVYREGGNWMISTYCDGIWRVKPCHYSHNEREVLQIALFGEQEYQDHTRLFAGKKKPCTN